MILTIRKIRTKCDFRKVHRPRRSVRVKRGEAHLLFNTAQTMARIITHDQDVFTFYADKGEEFDVQAIQDRLMRFGSIQMKVVREQSQTKSLRNAA